MMAAAAPAVSATEANNDAKRPDKKEWMAKMKEAKHEFIARELQLSDTQKQEFLPLYDRLQAERMTIERQARDQEKALEKKGEAATDEDYDAVIASQFSIEEKLSQADQKYLPKFKKILNRRQLYRLKRAERKFNRKLMEQRNCPPPPRKNDK